MIEIDRWISHFPSSIVLFCFNENGSLTEWGDGNSVANCGAVAAAFKLDLVFRKL